MRPLVPSIIFAVALAFSAPAHAQSDMPDRLDTLFAELAAPDNGNWEQTEQAIWTEWSRSGSAAMDLLLERGREAMQDGDFDLAIEHFTALTDHAPDFAEGWNARATAYFSVGKYGPSIADIQRTLILNPRHFGAMQGLGRILEEIGYPADALAAYREVLAIHPHRPNLQDSIERLEKEVGGTDL